MTKSRDNGSVGDDKSPPLAPTNSGLRIAVDQADKIQAEKAPAAGRPSVIQSSALAAQSAKPGAAPVTTCKQVLWLSFFFDGTGNNRYADTGLQKHSNVAKLFKVHAPNDMAKGIYSFYLQGVGTYFREVGDDGGSTAGLSFATKGAARLDFAFKQLDEVIKRHAALASTKASEIVEVNIAAFGFSRGAALARAFVSLLLTERAVKRAGKWTLKDGAWPLRVRFMGLFDTVASVGVPMSNNNVNSYYALTQNTPKQLEARLREHQLTQPARLAFAEGGVAGADPAPGSADGHSDWGNKLRIDPMVEEVRHFIAAHEIRNSFPVDSVSVLENGRMFKPSHFYETVYPGVHSDVGGSYAPGEGGIGGDRTEKLGLIPLLHMYKFALRAGVPLQSVGSWIDENKMDFETSPDLPDKFDYYMKNVGAASSLGELMNKNMALYYAWRFRALRLKAGGNKDRARQVASWSAKFQSEQTALESELKKLQEKEDAATKSLNVLLQERAAYTMNRRYMPNSVAEPAAQIKEIEIARQRVERANDEKLKNKARLDALPKMQDLQVKIDLYDKQLLEDVKAIREPLTEKGFARAKPEVFRKMLRPHYRMLVEAYENEFIHNKGLRDEKIIQFFDRYVHDSLAGFAKDATLPSDPRVIYLGGDEKYQYARVDGGAGKASEETQIA